MSGEFVIINKHLTQDLINLNLWNDSMKIKLYESEGSVQNIKEIPEDIRNLYKTVWEIPQKVIIDLSADRAIYICQSQSLNLFFEDPNIGKINSAHFYGWKRGLKTGMYYLRTRPKASAIKGLGIEKSENKKEEQEAIACSINNPESCEACSG